MSIRTSHTDARGCVEAAMAAVSANAHERYIIMKFFEYMADRYVGDMSLEGSLGYLAHETKTVVSQWDA